MRPDKQHFTFWRGNWREKPNTQLKQAAEQTCEKLTEGNSVVRLVRLGLMQLLVAQDMQASF